MDTQPREQLSLREVLGMDPEEALAEHVQFGRDCLYMVSITPQLREEHPDRWVAVYKEQVVAAAPTLDDTFTELERLGIPKGAPVLEFIAKEPEQLIL